jgi:ribonuclease E
MRRIAVSAGLAGLIGAALWGSADSVPPSVTLPKPTAAISLPQTGPAQTEHVQSAIAPPVAPLPAPPVVLDAVSSPTTLTSPSKLPVVTEVSPIRPMAPSAMAGKSAAVQPAVRSVIAAPVPFMEPPAATTTERPILTPKNGDVPGMQQPVAPVAIATAPVAAPIEPVVPALAMPAVVKPNARRGTRPSEARTVTNTTTRAPLQIKGAPNRTARYADFAMAPMPSPAPRLAPAPRVLVVPR